MKYLNFLFVLVCIISCLACPVYAESAFSGVGRAQVLADHISTAESAEFGDSMSDAFNQYGGKLPGIIDEVKQGWEDVFSGLAGVLKFLADTVGDLFSILPASYTVYIVMLCLCIAVSAIIKVLTE